MPKASPPTATPTTAYRDPGLHRAATDEFLRYFSVNQTLSRTVTHDVELNGQHLRRNDKVVISWLSANHDEKEFDRPGEIILDRAPNRHQRVRADALSNESRPPRPCHYTRR
jgi:cytochrome P450